MSSESTVDLSCFAKSWFNHNFFRVLHEYHVLSACTVCGSCSTIPKKQFLDLQPLIPPERFDSFSPLPGDAQKVQARSDFLQIRYKACWTGKKQKQSKTNKNRDTWYGHAYYSKSKHQSGK